VDRNGSSNPFIAGAQNGGKKNGSQDARAGLASTALRGSLKAG
jgi:hypothetical protein